MATHDYNLANQDGASFRSDLNNALAAIVSNNSSSTSPATTFAHQIWVDTTANVIKQRNAANDAWIELWRIDGGFNAKTFSSNVTLNAQSDLRFADSDSSNWVAFQAPATVASNVTWTLPSADGTADQALVTNGSGTLSWADAGGTTDNITEGNTSAEVVDTGSDGHFKVLTDGTEALRVDPSQRLLVGTNAAYTGYGASAANRIQIAGNAYNNAAISAFVFGNTQYGGYLNLGLSRNTTIDSHTVLNNNDSFGAITFNGSDGSAFKAGASIEGYVDGTPGTNDMPGRLVFSTNSGGSSPTERMRISSDGSVIINTDQAGTFIKRNAAASGAAICNWQNSSTTIAWMRLDGGLANVQANDVNLSDEREKKNIVNLDSTWDCLKHWELKKFHYNDQADTEDKKYGVVAQQIAPHCPEVIDDWVKQEAKEAELDSDGNVVTPAKEKIVRMGVKEQQMMWMAIKALQEAQTRIESLESANASLEARLIAIEGGA